MANIGSAPVFTTTEAVRGALGVDDIDLPDQMILDAQLNLELSLDLYLWCPNFAEKLAVTPADSDEAKLLQSCLKTYSKWFCAAEYSRRTLTFKQMYGDGKAEQRRFTNFDWEALALNCAAKRDTYKQQAMPMDPDIGVLDPNASYALASRGTPTYNPVTNEGA
mgnify:CR=1 FL=1